MPCHYPQDGLVFKDGLSITIREGEPVRRFAERLGNILTVLMFNEAGIVRSIVRAVAGLKKLTIDRVLRAIVRIGGRTRARLRLGLSGF